MVPTMYRLYYLFCLPLIFCILKQIIIITRQSIYFCNGLKAFHNFCLQPAAFIFSWLHFVTDSLPFPVRLRYILFRDPPLASHAFVDEGFAIFLKALNLLADI